MAKVGCALRLAVFAWLGGGVVAFAPAANAAGDSGRDVLGRAQEYVDQAASVEYTAELKAKYPDPTNNRQSVTDRIELDESAAFPNRGRSLVEREGEVKERLFIDDRAYGQYEGSDQFVEQSDIIGRPSYEGGGYYLFQRPQDLGDALRAARDPEIAGRRGQRTLLDVTFPADDLFTAGLELDELRGRLVVAPDGKPVRLVLEASGPDTTLEIDYRYNSWNGPVTIEPPSGDTLDLTPLLDEEAISAYRDAPVYQPAAIPEGWSVALAEVIPADETDERCDQVNVDYEEPEYEGYIETYMFPTECGIGAPRRSRDFAAGPYRGFAYKDDDVGDRAVELDVNGTRVRVLSDLRYDQLAEILSNLVPLDLANPPPATVALKPAT